MGRSNEFIDNPGQFEEARSRLLKYEVHLYTVDDLLDRAKRHVEARILPPSVVGWGDSPAGYLTPSPNLNLAVVLINQWQEVLQVAARDPASMASMPPQAFEELVAEIFRQNGYAVDWLGTESPDLGIDFVMRPADIPIRGLEIAGQILHRRSIDISDVDSLTRQIPSRFAHGAIFTSNMGANPARNHPDVPAKLSLYSPYELAVLARDVLYAQSSPPSVSSRGIELLKALRDAETRRAYGDQGRYGLGICPQCGRNLTSSRGKGDATVEHCEACHYSKDAYY